MEDLSDSMIDSAGEISHGSRTCRVNASDLRATRALQATTTLCRQISKHSGGREKQERLLLQASCPSPTM
jgi:hypothetical protein